MRISVVTPFHNEEPNVQPFLERLTAALQDVNADIRIICVDDGSRDGTFARLLDARKADGRVEIVKLSRNFGKEAALTAGLDHAAGDAVVFIDSDLQHPPELIAKFIDEYRTSGADVVYGARRTRETDSPLRAMFSKSFYKIFGMMATTPIPDNAGDFRLLSPRAADALRALPERKRFMKGLYGWIGFRHVPVEYDPEPRHSGASKWSFRKLLGYSWTGLVSFTAFPLRAWSFIGAIIALAAASYSVWIVIETVVYGRTTPGYASIATAVFFMGGVQLLSIGILGEYVARIFDETKGRPTYIVERIEQ